MGWIQVTLPQCRARFDRLAQQGDALLVSLRGDAASLTSFAIKGAVKGLSGTMDVEVRQSAPDQALSIKIPADAIALDLHLVDPAVGILDSHVEDTHAAPPRERALRPFVGDQPSDDVIVRGCVEQGEGPTIEFKPYVAMGDDKSNEIVRTVVAFANSGGGMLLIGVSDRCIVEGVERGISKGGTDLQAKLEEYVGSIKKKVADEINRAAPMQIIALDVDRHLVIAVQVTPGAETPYFVRSTNEVLVRRGSNNVRAHPDHDLPRLVRQQ